MYYVKSSNFPNHFDKFLPAKFGQKKNITPLSVFAIKKFINALYTKPLLGLKSDIHARMHQDSVDRKN